MRITLAVLAETIAGWVAAIIAKRHQPVWVLAALLTLYMGFMHLYLE